MRQWVRDAKRRRDQSIKQRHRDPGCKWNRKKDDRRTVRAPQLNDNN